MIETNINNDIEIPGKSFYYQLIWKSRKLFIEAIDYRAPDFLGYPINDILGKSIDNFVHPDDIPDLYSAYEESIINKTPYSFELTILSKNGEEHLIRDKGCALKTADNSKVVLVGAIHVIEDTDSVKEYMNRISHIIKQVDREGKMGIFYYSVKDNLIYWSEQNKAIHGIVSKNPSIEEYDNLVHKDDIKRHKQLFHKILKDGKTYGNIYRIIRQNDKQIRYLFTLVEACRDEMDNIISLSGTTIDFHDGIKLFQENSDFLKPYLDKNHQNADNDIIYIRHEGQLISIQKDHIIAISALGDYIQLYVENRNRPYVIHKTLKEIKMHLGEYLFIQVHRSHIVNKAKINKIHEDMLSVSGLQIPVSRRYKASLIEALNT